MSYTCDRVGKLPWLKMNLLRNVFLVTLTSVLASAKNISQYLGLPFNTPGVSPTSPSDNPLPMPKGYAIFYGGEAWKLDSQSSKGDAGVGVGGSAVIAQALKQALMKKRGNDSAPRLQPKEGTDELLNPSHVTALYRGIWVIHFKAALHRYPRTLVGQHRLENSPNDYMEDTFLLAGTANCSAKIPRRKFKDSEFIIRSVGPKEDWMSRPVAIFYSMKKFQGSYAVAELFPNATWTSLSAENVGFAPKSSIVINSNWYIETPSTSFCLIGQEDVSFIFDWKAEKYGDPDKDQTFPTVTPGCPTRPYQSQNFPEPTWEGRDFCYSSHE